MYLFSSKCFYPGTLSHEQGDRLTVRQSHTWTTVTDLDEVEQLSYFWSSIYLTHFRNSITWPKYFLCNTDRTDFVCDCHFFFSLHLFHDTYTNPDGSLCGGNNLLIPAAASSRRVVFEWRFKCPFPWMTVQDALCISVFFHLQNKTRISYTKELWFSLSVAICRWLDFHYRWKGEKKNTINKSSLMPGYMCTLAERTQYLQSFLCVYLFVWVSAQPQAWGYKEPWPKE